MLLALMALIGVALTIYRWPWTEVTTHYADWYPDSIEYQRRTTYRRDWLCQPVKHGVEQTFQNGHRRSERSFYDGVVHGPTRHYGADGSLNWELHFRAGQLHGPYRVGDGENWVWEGTYRDDKRDGKWRMILDRQGPKWPEPAPLLLPHVVVLGTVWCPLPRDPVVAESTWENDQRHGPFTLKTQAGEVLDVGEYKRDRLVSWNGEHVVDQLYQWLAGSEVNDLQLAQALIAEFPTVSIKPVPDESADYYDYPKDLIVRMSDGETHTDLAIYLDPPAQNRFWPDDYTELKKARPADAICEWAALNDFRFQQRFGSIWLVRADIWKPSFVDPTGVSHVQFPAGSQAAADWDEEIDVHQSRATAAGCVRQIFKDSSISCEITVTADRKPEQAESSYDAPQNPLFFRRKRRDALGFVLYRTGCRCELRDGALRVFSRDNRTGQEHGTWPLFGRQLFGGD